MSNKIDGDKVTELLQRIATSLESIAQSTAPAQPEITESRAYIWQADTATLKPALNTGALDMDMLIGLEQHGETLRRNTTQFTNGYAANNALLWGSRGTGKSSLVKAIHKEVSKTAPLYLIEIYREDLGTLTTLLNFLRTEEDKRFILFCDDLSFDEQETGYKSLKAILEGGVDARPDNVIFYATSNRRHLIPRNMMENERGTAIHKSEATEEKVSLSDRFGLWLGFYPCDQDSYLKMIDNYAKAYDLPLNREDLHAQAIEWERTRGARSGRVAWQFIQNLAGHHQKTL